MGDAISWVAVNDCGEVSLDSQLPPLPRGWERCLDLQSGVMYMKEMQTHADVAINGNRQVRSRATPKRQRVLLADDDDEGNPALQLTLAVHTSDDINQRNPSNQSSLSDADSCGDHGRRFSSSQKWMQAAQQLEEMTPASSNTSSASDNACFSSSFSSPLSKLKQWGSQADNLQLRPMKPSQDKNQIRAAGCPRCFMYVLPSKHNPKCPRCKSSILVDLSPLTIHH